MLLELRSADSYYTDQQKIAVTTVAAAKKLWRGMDDDFNRSWATIGPVMLETVQLGRAAAANRSVGVTAAILAETDQVAPPVGAVNPSSFLRSAPDGRPMGSLLSESVVQAKTAVKSGVDVGRALTLAEVWLTGALLTVMSDTGRAVVGADLTSRPKVAGYVRMLNGPSCPRCVILAGKWFRWNQGFRRHPRCDCRHVAAGDKAWAQAEGFVSDPYEYFHSMPPAEQDRVWGKINARAIRDGADIYRVENVRLRGLATAKGNLKYGTPSRITVDDIYRTAGTRTNAIKMMEREGFITGPQTAGGNIVGNGRERFAGMVSTPRPGSARERVLEARATGVRDPLDRATMTAQERRLFDANYRLEYARKHGTIPQSVGPNSADAISGSRGIPATPRDIERLEAHLQRELSKVGNDQKSLHALVDALGLKGDDIASIVFDRIEAQQWARFRTSTRTRR